MSLIEVTIVILNSRIFSDIFEIKNVSVFMTLEKRNLIRSNLEVKLILLNAV